MQELAAIEAAHNISQDREHGKYAWFLLNIYTLHVLQMRISVFVRSNSTLWNK